MILVSACLMGENCKYSGSNNRNEDVISFLEDKEYLCVCPEVFGGLKTPRPPAEIIGDRVVDQTGKDVTKEFHLGAEKTLSLAKEHDIDFCILKANSPSCGFGAIYDGTFSGKKINGNGVTVDLLLKNGFKVVSEKNIKKD
ncbi:MAG: DUF523 domain-containing protein [Firmicutes bacterium]|nr:DUF523 domain-containing protein [Bacillota bacterium]